MVNHSQEVGKCLLSVEIGIRLLEGGCPSTQTRQNVTSDALLQALLQQQLLRFGALDVFRPKTQSNEPRWYALQQWQRIEYANKKNAR
jgi:hypothetical protein